MADKAKIEIETMAKTIVDMCIEQTRNIERGLLIPKLVKQIYAELGKPNPHDYKGIGEHICYVDRVSGYTKYPLVMTTREMEIENDAPTNWRINRGSETKQSIVKSYTYDGWHCVVGAYNVSCIKYVPHKDYKNIWIKFTSTRDSSKYEYVFVKEQE